MSDDPLSEDASRAAKVHLDLEDGYVFRVDLGEAFPPLQMDEPEPLGEGSGPNASRILGAAVGNCLSASLLYCLRRARIEVSSLHTDVDILPARGADGRLRIGNIQVALHPEVAPGAEGRLQRCLGLFEDFCTVTQSVRQGINVEIEVKPETVDQAPPAVAEPADGDN